MKLPNCEIPPLRRERISVSATLEKAKSWAVVVGWLLALLMAYVFVALVDQLNVARAEAAAARESIAPAYKILEKCLSPGDNPIYIGDELHFCGAAPTGIKRKD